MEAPLLTKYEHIINITTSGNSSSVDQPPHEGAERTHPYETESFWNPIEFVFTLIQIVAAIVVLIQPKDEEIPQTLFFIWIIGYTCGCIASLPILCWRFWYYDKSFNSGSTEEYSGWTRVNEVMDTLKTVLDGFFVSWFVVFIWNFMDNPSLLDDASTQYFWLMTALLSFSFIRYILTNLKCALICFLMPVLLCSFVTLVVLVGIVQLISRFLEYIICR